MKSLSAFTRATSAERDSVMSAFTLTPLDPCNRLGRFRQFLSDPANSKET